MTEDSCIGCVGPLRKHKRPYVCDMCEAEGANADAIEVGERLTELHDRIAAIVAIQNAHAENLGRLNRKAGIVAPGVEEVAKGGAPSAEFVRGYLAALSMVDEARENEEFATMEGLKDWIEDDSERMSK